MYGWGIIKGMGVTLWNFILTYINPKKGLVTIQYPEERKPVEPRFRNFPFLVYDETPDNMRCVACDICAKECPPKCMHIIQDKDEQGKAIKRPAIFDIDHAICMNCGICEEVCPFDAIYMDHNYELGKYERQNELMFNLQDLLKPNEHFQKIRPEDAARVDEKRRTKGVKGRSAGESTAMGVTTAPPPPKEESK